MSMIHLTPDAGTSAANQWEAGNRPILRARCRNVCQHIVVFLLLILNCGTTTQADEATDNWPFYVPTVTEPPAVSSDWPQNGVDRFILKRLQEQGLEPAAQAGRRHLVRRLYYDLIGLPPSPEDVERFLEDKSEDAYERLVDRLLQDSRYGERWARLWLDLARYADTAGYEGDPDLPHAWRYRDYVIDAFNSDKPYDAFIREQIAGDEFDEIMGAGDLPGTPPERVVALTFLRLAPFTEPRGDETRHELLSEMTSTVASVFLGLTVGCAKCHDHKYDSIPTKDFYRLKAFFSTVALPRPEPGDAYQIGGSIAAGFYREGENDWAERRRKEFEREIGESRQALEQFRAELTSSFGSGSGFGLQAMGGPLGNDYIFGRTTVNDDKLHTSVVNCDGKRWTYFTDGNAEKNTGSNAGSNQGHWFGDIPAVKHVSLGQYSEGLGTIASGGAHHIGEFAQIMIFDHPLNAEERSALARWLSDGEGKIPPVAGLRFRLNAEDLDADPSTENPVAGSSVAAWKDEVRGITLAQKNSRLQPRLSSVRNGDRSMAAVTFDNDFLVGPADGTDIFENHTGALAAVYTARHTHEGYGFEVGGNGAFVSTFINPVAAGRENIDAVLKDDQNDLLTAEQRRKYRWLAARERHLRQQIKRLQPVAMSLRHSYGPPYEPGVPTSRVMIRGEYDNPGDVVQAGFLSCITGNQDPAAIRLDPFQRWPTRSRRMALANWIADRNNPMTARVMVNRLWNWHFGRGIVVTPSDFGQLSGGPSHPKLLDWLARQFIDSNWSIKKMHRLMVTSATYRQTSLRLSDAASEIDPENTLLWRFRRRRLEAEAVRDAVLSASGRLNPEQFGLPIFPPLPDDIEERVKYSDNKWNTQFGPEGRKRSIYIYQQRSLTMPFLQTFDALVCDESRPRRRHSVTPLQALAMYNGNFVAEEAKYFAARVRTEAGESVTAQIRRAFEIAVARNATAQEINVLSRVANGESGLVGVCRVLLNSSEFVYVD